MKNQEFLEQNGVFVKQALEIWGNDIEAYNENLKDYHNSLTQKLKELESYKNNYDYNNYGILAHSMKSESKYFGFMNEANVFYEHELAGKENNSEFINNNFQNLQQTVMKIITLLNQYFNINQGVKKNILAVDDSPIILNYIENSLKDEFNVLKALNGNEALEYLANNNIYVVFLDLNMPGSNGFEVLSYLKEHLLIDRVPIVIITGDDTKQTIEKAFSYPILDVLNKPFTEENLKRVFVEVKQFYENKKSIN